MYQILSPSVELTTVVTSLNIDILLLDEGDNLHVVGVAKDLNTRNSAGSDSARTMTLLRAPSDFLTLSVRYGRIGFRRGKEAKV